VKNTINEKEWKRDDCQRLPLDAVFDPDLDALKRLKTLRDEMRASGKLITQRKQWK